MVKRALLAIALVTSPALAADFDYIDAKGFHHWNHSRGVTIRRHAPPPVHRHIQVAQHARKHANPANEALFREFLAGRPAGAVSPPPLPEPPPTPKGTAPPPPEWAGTIEEAVKRWPHGE